jgi:hypothetical protein
MSRDEVWLTVQRGEVGVCGEEEPLKRANDCGDVMAEGGRQDQHDRRLTERHGVLRERVDDRAQRVADAKDVGVQDGLPQIRDDQVSTFLIGQAG